MSQTLAVGELSLGGTKDKPVYVLSVTTRASDEQSSPVFMHELTYRTIKAWLWIVAQLDQEKYLLPENMGSVESRYADDINKQVGTDAPRTEPFTFEQTFGESRVTVWDTYRGSKHPCFHLNSDDIPQVAIDMWVSNQTAMERILNEPFASKIIQDAPPASATPPERPATPKSQNAAPNGASPLLTKREAIATLPAGASFRMKVVQIKRRSTYGKDFYEFFEPYGNKPGDFSAVSVFTDNDIALNNGLIAYLDSFDIKVGQAITGEWITRCSVGKSKTKIIKGEEKTFTGIYINSFEGQPEKV